MQIKFSIDVPIIIELLFIFFNFFLILINTNNNSIHQNKRYYPMLR